MQASKSMQATLQENHSEFSAFIIFKVMIEFAIIASLFLNKKSMQATLQENHSKFTAFFFFFNFKVMIEFTNIASLFPNKEHAGNASEKSKNIDINKEPADKIQENLF